MGYYFDSIADSDEKTYFKANVSALYNGVTDLKFTSQMALSFSNIYLMKNAIELVYTDDYNSLKSVFGNIKVNGPGGILQWTTDGFSSGSVKLGYVLYLIYLIIFFSISLYFIYFFDFFIFIYFRYQVKIKSTLKIQLLILNLHTPLLM